jgi:hypothetical protein
VVAIEIKDPVSVVCVTICDAVSATPDPTPVPVFPDKE